MSGPVAAPTVKVTTRDGGDPMTEVRWDGAEYEMVLEGTCDASPADVYDVLADLSTHTRWAGADQHRGFRLLSLDGEGIAEAGTTFASVGSVPMSLSRWENHNEVLEARRPDVFAFGTDARVRWRIGKPTEARYEHRYEIAREGAGSRVVYRLRERAVTNPPPRMRFPAMRSMSYRVMIPWFCRRGFANLLREADRRAASAGSGLQGITSTR